MAKTQVVQTLFAGMQATCECGWRGTLGLPVDLAHQEAASHRMDHDYPEAPTEAEWLWARREGYPIDGIPTLKNHPENHSGQQSLMEVA